MAVADSGRTDDVSPFIIEAVYVNKAYSIGFSISRNLERPKCIARRRGNQKGIFYLVVDGLAS